MQTVCCTKILFMSCSQRVFPDVSQEVFLSEFGRAILNPPLNPIKVIKRKGKTIGF